MKKREPIKLICDNQINIRNDFLSQKIIANYQFFFCKINPQELVYLTMFFDERIEETDKNIVLCEKEKFQNYSLQLNFITQFFNRIFLENNEFFCYQDQIFINIFLNKMEISEQELFLKKIRMFKNKKSLNNFKNVQKSLKNSTTLGELLLLNIANNFSSYPIEKIKQNKILLTQIIKQSIYHLKNIKSENSVILNTNYSKDSSENEGFLDNAILENYIRNNNMLNHATFNSDIINSDITNSAISNNAISSNVISNNVISNSAISSNAISKNVISNSLISNKTISNNAILDNAISNNNETNISTYKNIKNHFLS